MIYYNIAVHLSVFNGKVRDAFKLEALNMNISCPLFLCLRFCCPVKGDSHVIPRDIGVPVGIQRGPADGESWSSGLCSNQFETTSLLALGTTYPRFLMKATIEAIRFSRSTVTGLAAQIRNNQRVYQDETCIWIIRMYWSWCIYIYIYAYAWKYIYIKKFFSIAGLCQTSTSWSFATLLLPQSSEARPEEYITMRATPHADDLALRHVQSIEGRAFGPSIVLPIINLTTWLIH